MLGILGGMGPRATVDFMQKVIALTPAVSDQDHIPMLVHNIPQIPDRSACILQGAEDPFPALLRGLDCLKASGARCVVMPCNTAHYWFERLACASPVSMISMIDCVEQRIRFQGTRKVGLMATSATVAAGMYRQRLESMGRECITPDQRHQAQLMQAIYDIKAGHLRRGQQAMEGVFAQLLAAGAEKVILGCTEIPVGLATVASLRPESCIDATALLAQACVDWYCSSAIRAA